MRRVGAAPSLLLSSLVLLFFALCCCVWWSGPAQALIPARYDGFVYRVGAPVREDSVVVEAFFDPLCPDSRDAWPPLKRVLHEYSPRVFLVVHPFPLPYHDNSFLSCRALHIANELNTTTTYPLLELFFKHQEKLYNKPTHKMSRESVTKHIINLAVEATGDSSTSTLEKGFEDPKTDRAARNSFNATGDSSTSTLEKGFEDPKTDRAARNSFNYGCSRGVTGTPSFLVNGFALPGAGSALGYEKWRGIIDPLLSEHSQAGEEAVPPFI